MTATRWKIYPVLAIILTCLTITTNRLYGEKPKTALILSGGGARGLSHIGVLKALEEIGFYPDMVIGTSMGALVGALYASGNTSREIEQYARNTKLNKLFLPKPYREIEFVSQKIAELPELFTIKLDENFNVIYPSNLLSAQQFQKRIFQIMIYPEYASKGNFDSLVIPFRAVATDIKTGQTVVLKEGSLSKAIAASSAFPIILAPVAIDSFLLVDGGLTNNVPCDVAVEMGAKFIIAVDVTSKNMPISENMDIFSYFNQAMNTLAHLTDSRNLYLADVLIRPEIDDYSSVDFEAIDSLIQRGYETTMQQAAEIQPYADSSKWDTDYFRNSIKRLNQTSIRSIKYSGNKKTRSYVIKRELLLKEGQLWNSAYAKRSLKNLFSTGIFKSVYMSLDEFCNDSADLIIEVEEEEKTLFSFGTRYDSEKKARAFITAKYRNLFGSGIDNQLSLIVSDQYRKLEINSRSTRILQTTFTGYSSLYQKFESLPLYQNGRRVSFGEFYRTGFEINAGIQIRRVGLSAVGLKLLHSKIMEDSTYTYYPIREDEYGTGSIIFRILVDNTDDPDIPQRGHKNNIQYEHSFTEDDLQQFDRISVESITYETYNGRHTFSPRLHFGYITKALSHYDRFRLGGVNTLPGFHQDEFWGNLLLSLGIGYRTPLTEGSFLQLQAMAGNVWNSFEDFKWEEIKIGARAGILIPTPLGPVNVDYGYNFRNRSLVYLSIGHFF
ncbi:MAG TPA: hypothetical protein DHW42_00800 [Candidatus Marinimicrobia bacterium]|nr:hypothetical protein [Candidatus Neomarinimicrobiota bacterium]